LLNKEDILQLCNTYNAIIVVDEAYIDFSEPSASLINEVKNCHNLVLMRTFSKAWGLAGVRLGFCAADEEIISYLFKVKAPYNINALTRYAVLKSITNEKKKESIVSEIIAERLRVEKELKSISALQTFILQMQIICSFVFHTQRKFKRSLRKMELSFVTEVLSQS